MTRSVMILGRQPDLGIAELESLFSAEKVHPLQNAAVLDADATDVPMRRLGGTVKTCKLLTTLPFTDWKTISGYLVEHVPKHTCCYGPGKLTFGISTYGLNVNQKTINATALAVKTAVKATDRPVRVVPTTGTELNSAQVLHNKMTDLPLGMELILVRDGTSVHLAQTIAVQNIEAYAARDQKRPKRDARVGMLPPKLAQIIVNMAVGSTDPKYGSVVLDPFCGTGVILQEASFMGFDIAGSDLDPRMVDYTRQNLTWFAHKPWSGITMHSENDLFSQLEVGDAASLTWKPSPNFIACETYLGRPFSAPPSPKVLDEVMRDVDTIHKKFLQNVARQTKPGFRLCIAVPAWKTPGGFKHLKMLDSLEHLGYTRQKFAHVRTEDLVYHRPEQIVARELVVLKRK